MSKLEVKPVALEPVPYELPVRLVGVMLRSLIIES